MIPEKNYLVHRFVWECYNCPISTGFVIDHYNGNKTDRPSQKFEIDDTAAEFAEVS